MWEIWALIKVYLWAVLLACLLSYVVGVVQKHYIDIDKKNFDSAIEGIR